MALRMRNVRGFSLAEVMIAVFIIGVMGAVAVTAIGPMVHKGRVSRVKEDLKVLDGALEMYEQDNGSYPGAEQGLEALIEAPSGDMPGYREGGYLKKKKMPKDAWNHEYVYVVPGPSGMAYDIFSYGDKGQEGGEGKEKDIKLSEIE